MPFAVTTSPGPNWPTSEPLRLRRYGVGSQDSLDKFAWQMHHVPWKISALLSRLYSPGASRCMRLCGHEAPAGPRERAMTRVLVTDGHELSGLATACSVGRGGFEVVVAVPAGRNRDAVSRSRYVHEVITSPDAWEESGRYEDWLATLAANGDLAAVFPVSEASLVAAVALGGDEGLSGVPVVMPDADSRRLSLSKSYSTRAAAEAGLLVPTTVSWYADGELDDEAIASWTFPFLVKSDNCHTSVGTYRRGRAWMVRSSDELSSVRLSLSGLPCQAIVQEAVPGTGVSACFYAEDGVPLLTFGHRRMHEVPWTGGWSSLRASDHDPGVLAQGRALLEHARYTGLAMVELRRDGDGPAFFLEVNGRPWGSLALALHAGADFPLLALQRAIESTGGHGRSPLASSPPAPRERVVICMNLVRGELDHLRSIAKSSSLSKGSRRRLLARHCASTARWIVDPRTRHDHLWWTDPGPGVGQVRVLAKLVRDLFQVKLGRYAERVAETTTQRHLLWGNSPTPGPCVRCCGSAQAMSAAARSPSGCSPVLTQGSSLGRQVCTLRVGSQYPTGCAGSMTSMPFRGPIIIQSRSPRI